MNELVGPICYGLPLGIYCHRVAGDSMDYQHAYWAPRQVEG
ncbi:MAG: hypothetical protein ACC700_09620 [Anaerolineales bacterium]